jgi:hypothetical protein
MVCAKTVDALEDRKPMVQRATRRQVSWGQVFMSAAQQVTNGKDVAAELDRQL